MRISDWSSDVCSSDLFRIRHRHRQGADGCAEPAHAGRAATARRSAPPRYPGPASQCRFLDAHCGRIQVRADSAIGTGQFRQCSNRSEEHTSELQSLMRISYAVFCLKKKKKNIHTIINKTK